MRILQLIDSLDTGGAERMAVNYANALQDHIEFSALAVTRKEGALKELLNDEVPYLFLNRTKTVDIAALLRLRRFIRQHKIQILQAHGSSYFIASLVKMISPGLKLIWHDHYGNSEYLENRAVRFLKWSSKTFDAVFAVNENLKLWAQRTLRVCNAFYVRNFIAEAFPLESSKKFTGIKGKRIVGVANLRAQKNHHLLLDAFEKLLETDPEYTLHLFGEAPNTSYATSLLARIAQFPVKKSVFYHGVYLKMSAILPHFDIGVLASASEGLPLALLEYGQARLPIVATDVGQCKEVLAGFGSCVPANDAEILTSALLSLRDTKNEAEINAIHFQKRVLEHYGAQEIVKKVIGIYDQII
ncbi:MAG: glycosyltransferase [Leeuwenhoekiella sp.]|uniref:glycosyltransferase n=1 Tax=Leeuwenhoekiella sp. TaxID=1977054 RepID=UPI003241FE45